MGLCSPRASRIPCIYTETNLAMESSATSWAMTQTVCFAFCRTISGMKYFGLTHGRDCYCAPYFKQIAGDSSECDAVCEGDNTMMCGGMSKSSIFEMHACNDAAGNLKAASTAAGEAR